jgi:hypothetical protein
MWVKVFIQQECSGNKNENELHRHDNIEATGWGEQFPFFQSALVDTRYCNIWSEQRRRMDVLFGARTRLLRDCGVIIIGREDEIMLRSVIFQCIAEYGLNILLLN